MTINTILIFALVTIFACAVVVTLTFMICKKIRESSLIAEREASVNRIRERDETIDALRQEIRHANAASELAKTRSVELERAEAELTERISALQKSKQETIDAVERRTQSLLDAQARSFDEKLVEKDNSLAEIIRVKNEGLEEQKKLLAKTEEVLAEKFGAVSLKSLESASSEFLKLATERFDKVGEVSKAELEKRQEAIDQLLKPVAETLQKLQTQNKEMEEKRVSAFDSIVSGIKTLSNEADQLANALRKPTSRGAWGEMNLHVILENAGLIEGEHFDLQDTTSDKDEGVLRTDVLIHLPSGRNLIIDSKAPLESFWEGMNAADELTRQAKFQAHARLVRDHVKALSGKAYWSRYKSSPDCVVMFMPTEGAYQAAIDADRALLTDAHKSGIYLANPMTVINMIHLTAYVLKEEKLRANAQEVQSVATELYKRLAKFSGDLASVGKSLRTAVNQYNSAVGSFDSRVMPQGRKVSQLGVGNNDNLIELAEIDIVPRHILSQELAEASNDLLSDTDETKLIA